MGTPGDYSRYLSDVGAHLAGSAIRRMGTVVARAGDLVSFAPGYPAPEGFPWSDLQEIAAELLTGSDPNVLQYGPTRGHAPLVATLVGILVQRDIAATPDNVLVTSGSQQGIDLIGRVLVSPGDVVLVELPTFTGAIAAFQNARARLVGVKQDAGGLSVDDLDDVWRRESGAGRRVKLVYVIPNFQNPTGRLLTLERRRRLLEWAARRDVLIVEDDPYGSLYFEDLASAVDTRPIKADDRDGRVLYLSSFSKTLAPGFRVGWMVAPAPLIERFDTAKQSTDLTSGILDQRMVHEAVRRGVIDRIAPTLRSLYRAKRDAMERALRERLATRLRWDTPKGGFFVWATLPAGEQDEALLGRALDHGVIFVVGSAFFVDGTGHDTIRLSFSAPPVTQLAEGVARLDAALSDPAEGPRGRSRVPATR
jgi:2-aminoadipate transaminase